MGHQGIRLEAWEEAWNEWSIEKIDDQKDKFSLRQKATLKYSHPSTIDDGDDI